MSQSFAEALSWLPKSRSLAMTLERAFDQAKAQSHGVVALEHLLIALVSDSDASAVLQACQIDLGRLNHDASGYLASLGNQAVGGPGVEPAAAPDLLRILEYAAAAAQQSRRREINGAIVLAAIVGDGRSPAAAMLRGQGLTFEEAVKALQRVNVAQRPAPQPVPAPAPQPAPQPYAPPHEAASPHPQPAPAPQQRPAGPPPGWHADEADPRTQLPPRYANGQPAGVTEELLARARQRVETGRKPAPEGTSANHQPTSPYPPDVAASAPPDDYAHEQPVIHQPPEPQNGYSEHHAAEAAAESDVESPYYDDNHPSAAPPIPPPEPPWAQRAPAPAPPRPEDELYSDNAHQRRREPQTALPPPSSEDSYRHHPAQSAPGAYRSNPSTMPPRPAPAPWPSSAPPGYPDGSPVTTRAPQPMPVGASAKPAGQAAAKKRGASVAAGQLVENVPRVMRVGRSEKIEVRIAKADVKALTEGLQGGGTAYPHEIVVTQAMSVRLRAPEGGFWVETTSPETQWIESSLGSLSDDYASWRWHVTPQRAGKARLQLVVSARTVGSDGLVAETALPDRVINVKVRINYTQSASHWGGWILAAVIGGVLARFGEGVWDFVQVLLGGTGG